MVCVMVLPCEASARACADQLERCPARRAIDDEAGGEEESFRGACNPPTGRRESQRGDARYPSFDAALDEVRERFGTAALTRGVLLGRDPGLTVPLLPD